MKGIRIKEGDKFNRLTVKFTRLEKSAKQNKTFAYCLCECGNEVRCTSTALVKNKTKSCGCLKAEKASIRISKYNAEIGHGLSNHKLYSVWAAMKTRCTNYKQKSYKDYGGRGIKVCKTWMKNFKAFYKWSIDNGYKEGLTLDRINVDGDYKPSNCRWVSKKTQAWNRRNTIKAELTAFGETKTLHEWSKDERCVVSVGTLSYRIGAGWDSELSLTKPSERKSSANGLYSLDFCRFIHKNYPEAVEQYLSTK